MEGGCAAFHLFLWVVGYTVKYRGTDLLLKIEKVFIESGHAEVLDSPPSTVQTSRKSAQVGIANAMLCHQMVSVIHAQCAWE